MSAVMAVALEIMHQGPFINSVRLRFLRMVFQNGLRRMEVGVETWYKL